jgi:hypothetical protein
MTIRLFQKVYDPLSINDMESDTYHAFEPEYNAAIVAIPRDESGQFMGKFKVTIDWIDG